MLSNDAENFFQSDRDLELAKKRSEKRATIGLIAGDPFEIPSKVMDFEFLSIVDGVETQHIMTAESGHIARLSDLSTKKTIATYRGHTGPVTSLCVAYDSEYNPEYLFTSSWDKTVKKFDIKSKRLLYTFSGHADFVKKVKLFQGFMFTCSADTTIKKWDLASGKELMTLKGHTRGVEDILIDDEGVFIYSCSSDTTIRKWSLETGKEVSVLTGHLTSVYQLCMNDGSLFSVSADKTCKRWNLESNLPDDSIEHDDFVKSVVIHGSYLITGCRDENIRVWDLSSGKLRFTIRGHYGEVSVLKVRGNTLFSGGLDGTVRKWSLAETDLIQLVKTEEIKAGDNLIEDDMMTEEERRELQDLMD